MTHKRVARPANFDPDRVAKIGQNIRTLGDELSLIFPERRHLIQQIIQRGVGGDLIGPLDRVDDTLQAGGFSFAFHASPRASWISGSSVTVDGCQSRSQI